MKKIMCSVLMSVIAIFVLSVNSMASTITFTTDDVYANWPGHFVFTSDTFGTPLINDIGAVDVTTVDGYLKSVVVHMSGRILFDNLFINADPPGNNYEAWDYLVTDTTLDDSGAKFYAVSPTFNPSTDYILATAGRVGHPVGIKGAFLTEDSSKLISAIWNITSDPTPGTDSGDDVGTLTYTFNQTIFIGDANAGRYVIGYTPYCANDVYLTPQNVPEPATILLLGISLIGVAGIGRKLRS